eukprot:156724-Pelagomonas_calceolata.AAC.1
MLRCRDNEAGADPVMYVCTQGWVRQLCMTLRECRVLGLPAMLQRRDYEAGADSVKIPFTQVRVHCA